MTITIENADKNLVKAVKSVANLQGKKIKVSKINQKSELKEALKELEYMEKNPHLYKSYKNINSLAKALRK